jgi:ribose 5-phosphate isomerase A
MTDAGSAKAAAAERAAAEIDDGMIVGLGTGSTAALAVAALGRRVRAGLRIAGVPTSEATAELARAHAIPLVPLDAGTVIDVTIDGADEVDRATRAMIKGRGGALLREKIVACASRRLVIVIDPSKWVDRLGAVPVPVEVVPFGWGATAAHLRALGTAPELRAAGAGPFVTDGGHYILDCRFGAIADAAALAARLDGVVGVVEHGLFVGFAPQVVDGTVGLSGGGRP